VRIEFINDINLYSIFFKYLDCDSEISINSKFDSSIIISELIRKIAFYNSPLQKRKIIEMIFSLMQKENMISDSSINSIKEITENMLNSGEIIEIRKENEYSLDRLMVYISPKRYIKLENGFILILGYDENINNIKLPIIRNKHLRYTDDSFETQEILLTNGFTEIKAQDWLNYKDDSISPLNYMNEINEILNRIEKKTTIIENILVFDHSSLENFYPKRWTENINRLQGRYVARRPLKYGSYIWCLAEIEKGAINKFVDLPIIDRKWSGYDEGRRIILANDYINNRPAKCKISYNINGNIRIDFYQPIPSWGIRRLEISGEITKSEGALFTYIVTQKQIKDVEFFIKNKLWFKIVN